MRFLTTQAQKYGKTFLFWPGNKAFLVCMDVDKVRQILTDTKKFIKGDDYTMKFSVVFGEGLVTSFIVMAGAAALIYISRPVKPVGFETDKNAPKGGWFNTAWGENIGTRGMMTLSCIGLAYIFVQGIEQMFRYKTGFAFPVTIFPPDHFKRGSIRVDQGISF